MAEVKVTINNSAVINVVGPQINDAAYRAAQAARGRAMANIIRLGRIASGEMIQGMQVRRTIGAAQPLYARYDVYSTAKHTDWQERGTRAHGPVRAPRLVFRPKGSNTVVYAKWVRGVTPGFFMRDAVNAVRMEDFL